MHKSNVTAKLLAVPEVIKKSRGNQLCFLWELDFQFK